MLLFFVACQDKSKQTIVDITVLNSADSTLVVKYGKQIDTLFLKNGSCTFIPYDKYHGYVSVSSGDNSMQLYVQPGFNLKLSLNAESWLLDSNIKGDGEEINSYLLSQAVLLSEHKLYTTDFIYSASQQDYIQAYYDLRKKLFQNLNELINSDKNQFDEFEQIEKLRINVILDNIRFNYGSFVDYSTDITKTEKEAYYSFIDSLDFTKEEWNEIPEFIDLALAFIDWKVNKISEEDTSLVQTFQDYTELTFSVIDDYFSQNQIFEQLYYVKLHDFINYFGIDFLGDYYAVYQEITTSNSQKVAIDDLWNAWGNISEGKKAPDFSYPDRNGEMHSLSDYKGNLVYIDVWASWCGPCKYESPYFKALIQQFQNSDVVFIGVSVDSEKTQWLQMLDEEQVLGTQLYAGGWNTSICADYLIHSIPRFLLIDRDGNIISSNAPRPSAGADSIIEKTISEQTYYSNF
jgi:peroxiredoxin